MENPGFSMFNDTWAVFLGFDLVRLLSREVFLKILKILASAPK